MKLYYNEVSDSFKSFKVVEVNNNLFNFLSAFWGSCYDGVCPLFNPFSIGDLVKYYPEMDKLWEHFMMWAHELYISWFIVKREVFEEVIRGYEKSLHAYNIIFDGLNSTETRDI